MRTAAICPTCATYENALCIIYNGAYLPCLNVSPLDSLEGILQKINDAVANGCYSTTTTSTTSFTTTTTTTVICLGLDSDLVYNLSTPICIGTESSYYGDSQTFLETTILYNSCTVLASEGYYSDGTDYRYWTGTIFTIPSGSCASLTTTTTSSTTSSTTTTTTTSAV